VTTVPAHIYGVADRGEVRAGATADVVVWSGDPLELGTLAEVVVIGGTRLLQRYRTLPVR